MTLPFLLPFLPHLLKCGNSGGACADVGGGYADMDKDGSGLILMLDVMSSVVMVMVVVAVVMVVKMVMRMDGDGKGDDKGGW